MERRQQQLTMSVKQRIHEIEHAVNRLKSNDLDFEDQVDVYQQTLKKVADLHQSITELRQKVTHAELFSNDT